MNRSLCLNYGVYTSVIDMSDDMDEIVEQNVELAKKALDLTAGDKVVVTSGIASKKEGQVTNFMKVEEIK